MKETNVTTEQPWCCVTLTTVENVTVPFNNMRILEVKAQPTNAFFATVNQMFGGSSQLPATAEHAVIESLTTF